MERVFGFEIMPAPFVVAHLQVGLTMQDLDAPLADDGTERVGVYLTNALTGWEPRTNKPLPFPELEEERDRAERVKQDRPILVILGNPPYNGFAGMAVYEERELSDAYRTTKRVRRPEGQGLNDLYVRFFRMAERRIAERTGCGVVCFISNYSWLDGLSFTGMRERYLEAFDAVRIDCLNGDKYKTGKVAPDGSPDPSIFSTDGDPVGIQVGTAIAMLIRKADHRPTGEIGFRHLWGQDKPEELIATAATKPDALYDGIKPVLPLGLPFVVTAGWGHSGSGDAVMPGQGRAVERAYTPSERAALGDAAPMLGRTTFDIYLNRNAFWRNVPAAVWTYKLGGYQVLKKWLSYRERGILERALTPPEVLDLMKIARRIAAILTIPSSMHPLRSRNDLAGVRS